MPFPAPERTALLARYAAGPTLFRQAWDAVPPEVRMWRPGPERWSPLEVVAHCADSETTSAIRIRLLLAEPEPLIVGYDEVAWARVFDYHQVDPEEALSLISQVRTYTHRTLVRLPDGLWGRMGRHTQSGPYGTDDWLVTYAEHLEIHARQLTRILAAWHER